jgi:hypothetical protein
MIIIENGHLKLLPLKSIYHVYVTNTESERSFMSATQNGTFLKFDVSFSSYIYEGCLSANSGCSFGSKLATKRTQMIAMIANKINTE